MQGENAMKNKKICIACVLMFMMVVCYAKSIARCIKSNLIATPNGEVDLSINKSDDSYVLTERFIPKNGHDLEIVIQYYMEDLYDAASRFDQLSRQEDIEGNLFEVLYWNEDITIYTDDMCYISFVWRKEDD